MKIFRIEENFEGSTTLILEVSQQEGEQIEALFSEGKLTKIIGIPVQNVQLEAAIFTESIQENTLPSSSSPDTVSVCKETFLPSKTLVNLSQWLPNILDEGWQVISELLEPAEPSFAYVYGLRSRQVNSEESDRVGNLTFGEIRSQLIGKGREIPSEARGAYRDFNLSENPLRLYAVTWSVPTQKNATEWTLLLILGAQPGHVLPPGIKLQVSDQAQILVEQVVEPSAEETYLYTCVVGTWDEQFIVTVALINGEALTLPPFAFISKSLP
jgi:hypothetical protein